MLLSSGLTALVLVSLRFILKSWSRSGVVTGAAAYVFFITGDWSILWASITVLLAGGIAIGVGRLRRELDLLSAVLSVAFVIIVAVPVVDVYGKLNKLEVPRPQADWNAPVELPPASESRLLPDIYFIVVDGLGRLDVLDQMFGIQQREVAARFESLGFQIAQNSFSNYAQTALSVATTLNLTYVHRLLQMPRGAAPDRRPLSRLISDSKLVNTLRTSGYKVVAFPAGYNLTRMRGADVMREPSWTLSYLGLYLANNSIMSHVSTVAGAGPAAVSFASHRRRLRFILRELPAARQGMDADQPVFVFAHVLAPHPPFVFGPSGENLKSTRGFTINDGNHWHTVHRGDGSSYAQLYRDQATFILDALHETVAEILRRSPRPPIIVVQGDHGPGSRLNWEKPRAETMVERFAIFNAWYLPPRIASPMYPEVSPVNTFRMLLNAAFGTELARLDDRAWFSDWLAPWQLFELQLRQ
jgi:hypothetical protein